MAEKGFDPGAVSVKNGRFFGFPYSPGESEIVILSAPWDVTTSYRDGTANGPKAILEASYQLDYTSPFREKAWNTRVGTLPLREDWHALSRKLRVHARELLLALESGEPLPNQAELTQLVNEEGARFHRELEQETSRWLEEGKRVITLGGDHSVSLGPIRAHAAKHSRFSILHLDAHADLRVAYEGFEHSHASIMNHVKDFPEVEALVQVGIRDYSPDEAAVIRETAKIHTFFDWDLKSSSLRGESWQQQCQKIIAPLGELVYISADIDGLDPRFCPGTGTPVPGGLQLEEFLFLLQEVEKSGRKFVGADLVEVAPEPKDSEWDANVGARLLFQFCQFLRNSI